MMAMAILIIAVALLTTAAADTVTWDKYKDNFNNLRVLGARPDNNATTLALELCNITEIHPGDFDGLPSLTIIELNDNSIQHLDPSAFTSVNGLKGLFLDHNHLTEVPQFYKLSLFPVMTTLTLSHNKITKLDDPNTFTSMHSLEQLSVNRNSISYVHSDIFKPLIKLQIISLHHNNLTYIPGNLLHIHSLRIIFLQNNRINHIAPEAIRSSSLEALFLKENRLAYLPQRFVLKLKSASSRFDLLKFKGNPWQCGCLLEILTEVNTTGVRGDRTGSDCKAKDVPCNRSGVL